MTGTGTPRPDAGAHAAPDRGAQLRVVRGAPDDLEVAALVAGLAAAAAAGTPDDAPPAPVDEWTARARGHRGAGTGAVPGFGGPAGRHDADAWRWSLRS